MMGFAPDNALIDQLKLGVRAGAADISRIKDMIAEAKMRHLRAEAPDNSRSIKSQDARLADRIRMAAEFGIDRVDRNRLDLDQKLSMPRQRFRQLDIHQRLRIRDRAAMGIGNRFHGLFLSCAWGENLSL